MHRIDPTTMRSGSSLSDAPSSGDHPMMQRRSSSAIWINDQQASSSPSGGRRSCKRWISKSIVFASVLGLFAGSYYMGSVASRLSLESQLEETEAARRELLENQKRLLTEAAELGRYTRDNEELARSVDELQKELDEKKKALQNVAYRRSVREEEVFQVFDDYQGVAGVVELTGRQQGRDNLARFIKTMAYDRYGAGPHQVQFAVRIWDDDDYEDAYFTVDVASFQDMPASSFLFLEQVDRGLWDGTSFHINAPETLVAQPVAGTHDVYNLPEMEALGLARVPILEQRASLPPDKYTLCFGGSSGTAGSFFYINKVSSASLQPGQACFAKVILGLDVIDRIAALKTDSNFHIQPVDIRGARVLENENIEFVV